jgi:hypothetical protein
MYTTLLISHAHKYTNLLTHGTHIHKGLNQWTENTQTVDSTRTQILLQILLMAHIHKYTYRLTLNTHTHMRTHTHLSVYSTLFFVWFGCRESRAVIYLCCSSDCLSRGGSLPWECPLTSIPHQCILTGWRHLMRWVHPSLVLMSSVESEASLSGSSRKLGKQWLCFWLQWGIWSIVT